MIARWLTRAGVICTIVLVSAPPATIAASAYLPRGVYGLVGPRETVPSSDSELMAANYISGFAVIRNWDTIEATKNVYNWREYDELVDAAEVKGKDVILGIYPGLKGSGLPGWYTGQTFSCRRDVPATVGPVPWDTRYKSEIKDAIVRMVQRYDSSPAIAGYILSGFYQWKSMDFDLCTGNTADRDAWIDTYGYTRQKIKDAFLAILSAVQAETQKPLLIAVAGMFNETRSATDTESTKDFIITPFYQEAPVQAGIGRTIFKQDTADPEQIWNRSAVSAQFQLLLDRSPDIWGQREVETKGGAKTPADFEKMFDIALHYGVSLFEIGASQALDADNISAITCMNDALIKGGGHCGH